MRRHARNGPSVFFCFRDSPLRRTALAAAPGSPERYCLHGLDEVAARGATVRHNLETSPGPLLARIARTGNRALHRVGGYGGDFASVLASRRVLNRADVVLSTVDTLGLPVVLLRRARLVRPPVVYLAIGLPERLVQLRGGALQRAYASALREAHTVAAFSRAEVEAIGGWLDRFGARPRLEFVPFGVDTAYFAPRPGDVPSVDVVSIGADPHRDYDLLVAAARELPERSVRIVASAEQVRALGPLPANVGAEFDVPFAEVRPRLAAGRVVALPVVDNSYSGGTTVLLQAMATGRPIVVSRTAPIAEGYGLEDGVNCSLVPPGDPRAFARALAGLLADPEKASRLGAAARETAVASLGWDRYTDRLYELVAAAAGASP